MCIFWTMDTGCGWCWLGAAHLPHGTWPVLRLSRASAHTHLPAPRPTSAKLAPRRCQPLKHLPLKPELWLFQPRPSPFLAVMTPLPETTDPSGGGQGLILGPPIHMGVPPGTCDPGPKAHPHSCSFSTHLHLHTSGWAVGQKGSRPQPTWALSWALPQISPIGPPSALLLRVASGGFRLPWVGVHAIFSPHLDWTYTHSSMALDTTPPYTRPRQSSRKELSPTGSKARLALCAVWVVGESWSTELCRLHPEMRGAEVQKPCH